MNSIFSFYSVGSAVNTLYDLCIIHYMAYSEPTKKPKTATIEWAIHDDIKSNSRVVWCGRWFERGREKERYEEQRMRCTYWIGSCSMRGYFRCYSLFFLLCRLCIKTRWPYFRKPLDTLKTNHTIHCHKHHKKSYLNFQTLKRIDFKFLGFADSHKIIYITQQIRIVCLI